MQLPVLAAVKAYSAACTLSSTSRRVLLVCKTSCETAEMEAYKNCMQITEREAQELDQKATGRESAGCG